MPRLPEVFRTVPAPASRAQANAPLCRWSLHRGLQGSELDAIHRRYEEGLALPIETERWRKRWGGME